MVGHALDLAIGSRKQPTGLLFSIAVALRPYLGFICVVGFIVLSGYCIARSTMKNFSPGRYAVMRVTRLYPLLLVATLVTAFVEWFVLYSPYRPNLWNEGIAVPCFVLAIGGLSAFKCQFGALAPAYTISFELMYYVIWGIAMTAVSAKPARALMVSTAIAVVLLPLQEPIRTFLAADPRHFLVPLGVTLLPAWLLGASLCIFQTPLARLAGRIPVWAAWLVVGWAFAYGFDHFHKPRSIGIDYSDVAYFVIISGLFVIALAAMLARPSPAQNPTDRHLGEISYPLFLIHGPVIVAVQFAMNQLNLRPPFDVALAILAGASVAVAALLTVLVERPVMAWRRKIRLPSRDASIAAAAEPA